MKTAIGRPRAVDLEERAMSAAIDVYAEQGWSGYSIERVATRAGVGKSALYLRWPGKVDLLVSAFQRSGAHVEDVDTGEVRTDLVALAERLFRVFDGTTGVANRRLQIDSASVPELQQVQQDLLDHQVAAARSIVRRGVARGQLGADVPVGVLLNAVCGGVINYVATRPSRGRMDPDDPHGFCVRLVELVLPRPS